MPGCSICGASSSLLYDCNYCTGEYCKSHRLPENHNCPGLQHANTQGPELRDSISGGFLGSIFGSKTEKSKGRENTGSSDTDRASPGAELPGAAKDYTPTSSPDVNPDGSIARPDDGNAESDSQPSLAAQGRRAAATVAGLAIMAILAPFRVVKRLPSYLRRFNRWLSRLLGSVISLVKTVTPILLVALGALFVAGLVGTGVPVIDENAEAGASGVAGVFEDDNAEEVRLMEQAVHEEVNRVRENRGLNTLSYNHEMAGVARNHSRDMAERNYFDHVGPNGTTLSDRLDAGGVSCTAAGENLATLEGFGSDPEAVATRVVEMWLNSPGHRENLLRSGWVVEGIGVEIRGDEIWVTQVFCS